MAASFVGGGVVNGFFSGAASAAMPVQGPAPAGVCVVVTMFDHTGALRADSGGRQVSFVSDSQGNSYRPLPTQFGPGTDARPNGLVMYGAILTHPLTAADTITVGWTGGSASFYCYGAEFGGIAPADSSVYPDVVGGWLQIGAGVPGEVSVVYDELRSDLAIAAAVWSGSVGQDAAWDDIGFGPDGHGNFVALAYAYRENLPLTYHTTGSGSGVALATVLAAVTEPTVSAPPLTVTSIAGALDDTIPGGYRLDIAAAGFATADESHSPTVPYLDGSDSYNYPAASVHSILGPPSTAGALLNLAFAQDWNNDLPPDSPVLTQMPALLDVTVLVQSFLTDAKYKIGGQPEVNSGHSEDIVFVDLGAPTTPLTGTIIDGSGTHTGVPLEHHDTSGGVTFILPRITIPSNSEGVMPLQTLAMYETPAAVFNSITINYTVRISIYFGPESFPPPPPPVLPIGPGPPVGTPGSVQPAPAEAGIVPG